MTWFAAVVSILSGQQAAYRLQAIVLKYLCVITVRLQLLYDSAGSLWLCEAIENVCQMPALGLLAARHAPCCSAAFCQLTQNVESAVVNACRLL
jgi:hypothetical protein